MFTAKKYVTFTIGIAPTCPTEGKGRNIVSFEKILKKKTKATM